MEDVFDKRDFSFSLLRVKFRQEILHDSFVFVVNAMNDSQRGRPGIEVPIDPNDHQSITSLYTT